MKHPTKNLYGVIFIENTDVDTVKISGIATMLSDSEQNAGNTQR